MTETQTVTETDTVTEKPKKKQVQPRYHAIKSRLISKHRRAKIIEDCLNGVPRKETVKELGLSPKTGVSQISQILNEPNTKASFLQILEKSGLTDQRLSDKLRDLIDAQATQYFQFQGKVEDERVVPALETQRKTAELVCRLRGHLKADAGSPDISIGLMQIVVQQLAKS